MRVFIVTITNKKDKSDPLRGYRRILQKVLLESTHDLTTAVKKGYVGEEASSAWSWFHRKRGPDDNGPFQFNNLCEVLGYDSHSIITGLYTHLDEVGGLPFDLRPPEELSGNFSSTLGYQPDGCFSLDDLVKQQKAGVSGNGNYAI
jgi:hypothetical protein